MSGKTNKLLQFHSDTVQSVRKFYNLEDPEKMDEAIDILEDWIKKQNHFVKKDFPRKYLETNIISNKGSIERTKSKMEKLCTLRTLFPHLYKYTDIKEDFKNLPSCVTTVLLPKLTKDHYRVFSMKLEHGETFNATPFTDYYIMCLIFCEYAKIHDYSNGYIFVVDYRNVSVLDVVSKLNALELKQLATLLVDGYGMRVKGIHILTPSKSVETLMNIMKPLFPAKLAKRFQVHQTLESLYKVVPKDILPVEYGGPERSLKDLNSEWMDELSSKENMDFLNWIREAGVNESYRIDEKYREYAGMAGTFRTLKVD